MHIRKKRAFRELLDLLRLIEIDPHNVQAVREINQRLIKLIFGVEEAIAHHLASKKELRKTLKLARPSRLEADELRRKIKRIESYIRAQRDQMYVWKCFGDALAFSFLDPLSIKHMFFDTADYEVKQDAGTLSGKSGFIAEKDVLEDALNHGVPAVLCDLTNTLRFGDICLLGGSDPYPIEVKTSPRLNQRGKRQQTKLRELRCFLQNDIAENFRGQKGRTSRVISGEQIYHTEVLNTTVQRAYAEGYATHSPEEGLYFLCIKTDWPSGKTSIDVALEEINLDAPEVFDLNHFKNGHGWAFYLPFLLSIRDPEHLLDFLEGRLYIIVFVEATMLASRFEGDGWEARYRPGEMYPIQCLHGETGAYYGVSSQFIARAALEFLSFESIVSTQKVMPTHLKEISEEVTARIEPTEFRQLLVEQFGEGDEWIERILSAKQKASCDI